MENEKNPERKSYTVFISSTFLDNQERRSLVEDAILRADMRPVGMERFTASTDPALEKCEQDARDCDVYLGIIAHRYGWIPEGKDISITELEYEAAKQAGRPRLMFEIDPSIRPDLEADFDPLPSRWQKQDKLEAFRAKFRQDQMPGKFKEKTLSGMVVQALNHYRDEREGKANTVEPTSSQNLPADELARYRQTIESLHASLPLAGFKTKLRVPIDLEDLYVPLQAMVDLRAFGDSRYADSEEALEKLRGHNAQDIPLIEAFRAVALRKRRGVVILGDPGSGKTTHLKRLLLACLREGPDSLGLPSDLLPVFLPLRELGDVSSGMESFIEKTLASPHLQMELGFGKRLLQRGHLLLLFDGLDEVSEPRQRAKVSRWIEQALKHRPDCHAVVTCRFAGYDDDARLDAQFLELHLRPLNQEQAENFIRHWYTAVETGLAIDPVQGEIDAAKRAEELIERLKAPDFRSARMFTMTRNPLLLANLCLVHRDRGALPKGRHQLYDECIDVLLERWREGKDLAVNIPAELGRRVLQPAALWLHEKEGRTRASAEELTPALESVLKQRQWPGGDAKAFLRTVRDDSGLLTGWSHEQYGFMHLGFQEYLAACELRRLAFEGDKAAVMRELAGHYGQSWWQEVILLLLAQGNPSLFGPFMQEALRQPLYDGTSDVFSLILEEAAEATPQPFVDLLKQQPGNDPNHWARQYESLRVVERLLPEAELQSLAEGLRQHPAKAIQAWTKAQTKSTAQTTRITPNGGVELVLIPGGQFPMGSPKGKGYEDEKPQHWVNIQPFYLGRYPVTNEEYGRFLQANVGAKEPGYWSNRQFNQARQPVVGVSWDEACRYAEWAGGRLPSEAEWEYACRAGTETEYWWGDGIGKNRANGRESGSQWSGKQPSPVGSFEPNRFGLYDTSGNVWEWLDDVWHANYQGAPIDGKAWTQGGDQGRRVVRGGSWNYLPVYLRSANRFRNYPDNRTINLGFRLAQDL
jgi:formylglycine-generating enzyme required for sulfatase activity